MYLVCVVLVILICKYVGSCRESYLLFWCPKYSGATKNSLPKTWFYFSNELFSSQRWLQLDTIEETPIKMPKWRVEVDPRERKAVSKLACTQYFLSTLEAMLATKFSKVKANNHTLQQCIWQQSKTISTTNSNNNTSQVPSVINNGIQNTTISDITDSSIPPSMAASTLISKSKLKHLQKIVKQTHQKHVNNATKHATKWHAAEEKKR